MNSRYDRSRRASIAGLSKDQKNAAWILEKVMHRQNYSSETRDEIAECLIQIRLGGELGKSHKVVGR